VRTRRKRIGKVQRFWIKGTGRVQYRRMEKEIRETRMGRSRRRNSKIETRKRKGGGWVQGKMED
jgi:hypothetical protein